MTNKMGKIKITESELRQLVSESVVSVLNESVNDAYTLDDLLRDQNYNGNKQMLLQALSLGLTAYRKSKGVNGAMALTNRMRIKGSDWMQIFKYAQQKANPAMRQVIANISAAASQTINAKSAADGVRDAISNPDADVKLGQTGRYTPGETDGMNPNGKPMSFAQIMNVIQGVADLRGDSAIKFTDITQGSAGALRGQNPAHVKSTIEKQLRNAGVTLKQTNPQGLQNATRVLTQWLNGQNHAIKMREVASALATIGKVINTSRNDMPAVRGFQQTLNLFGLKDAKGRPFAVDGIIGQNTSAALKQNGFNNIFDFINVVKGVQKALGLKDDGIVGKNTLAAFQQNGINSFDILKNFARIKDSKENLAQNQISQGNLTMPTPQLSAPQTGGLVRENKKIKISENVLKKLIKESVENILKTYKK